MINRKIITATASLAIALVLSGCELGTSETPSTIPIRNPYVSVQPASYAYVIGGEPEDAYTGSPELEIKIYDWNEENGKLALQWYTFDSVAEYCETGGGRAVGSGYTYTPPALAPEAGKRHYYYVQITNTNDVTDKKTVTIRSEVAVLSFRGVNDPAFPVILRQPAGSRYQFGRAIGGIKVEAEGAVLAYQWYSSPSFSVNPDTAVKIEGATQSSFIPDADTLRAGSNYFFVEITSAQNGKTATELSLPAAIEMILGERAAAPRIDAQPRDQLAFAEDTLETLTVTAASPDSGQISYQWYSNTRSATSGAEAISGATGSSYTPVIESGASRYYYVAVTNTNNNVEGEKEASVNSKIVKVSLQNSGTMDENATVNISDPSVAANRFNYVRGYGGMEVLWGNFPNHETADTELMYDPDRLGYNMLRIMIPPTSTDMEVNMADALERLNPNYYENVKIVNKYGGYVAAAPWSPPKEWKSNNSTNGGGNLIPSYYKLYANYLKNFSQHMYDHGAPIYVISIQNEPNYIAGYDGCEWTAAEMRDFFLEVGHFTDGVRGYGGGRETPVVLTMNGESANTPNINLLALNDPRSNAVIDVLARHVYGEQTVNLWNTPNRNGKEVWMTEHNINSANATGYTLDSTWNYIWRFMNDVDLVMRLNNENAFVWWASKRFYSMVGDGQYDSPAGQALPRGYGLSHYSKFTIDKTRIWWSIGAGSTTAAGAAIPHNDRGNSIVNNTGFSLDNLSPRITAYVSEDGNEISLVMWTPTQTSGAGGTDMGTIKINLPDGFIIRGAAAVRSTAPSGGVNTYMVDEEVTVSPDRKSAYVTLPRSQILSVKFTR
jgi:O-glycosyl hydrolase